MRFIHITLLLLLFVVIANGGKVNWDSKGKPQIERSDKPVKGCNQKGLEKLLKENNSSSCSK